MDFIQIGMENKHIILKLDNINYHRNNDTHLKLS